MSEKKTDISPELELNKESGSELGPEEIGSVVGGFATTDGPPTSAQCCIGCNTMDTVTSGCKGIKPLGGGGTK